MGAGVAIPVEAIVTLRRRLLALPARHPERGPLLAQTADLYGVSRATLYRLLRGERRPKDAHRADRGTPRIMPADEIECGRGHRDDGQHQTVGKAMAWMRAIAGRP